MQTGKGAAREGPTCRKPSSVAEWTTVQLSVTKVGKWPGPNLRCLHRELQFEIRVLAASGRLMASPRIHGPGHEQLLPNDSFGLA